ncbi:MAG: hypothetical protein Q4A47_00315 [Erysipelotrichaceae bacterium]|nr:hypothetical protein [Erysipelotrichaceae bacterium]
MEKIVETKMLINRLKKTMETLSDDEREIIKGFILMMSLYEKAQSQEMFRIRL